ncbi:hypothetical protein F5B21DRAFT_136350 [Xylaria acuta]|nr:hypothetical protein F5B21DRAFT_136350 [Xylaria acuta]
MRFTFYCTLLMAMIKCRHCSEILYVQVILEHVKTEPLRSEAVAPFFQVVLPPSAVLESRSGPDGTTTRCNQVSNMLLHVHFFTNYCVSKCQECRGIPGGGLLTLEVFLRPIPNLELLTHELDERARKVLGRGTGVRRDKVVAIRHATCYIANALASSFL